MEFISKESIEEITWEIINNFLIPDFIERGHNDTGNWVNSLSVRVEENTNGFTSIISGPDYTEYLIRGRGPNKDQRPEAINQWARGMGKYVFEPWVRRKGININPYAIAYTIARQGTKEHREGDHSFLEVLSSSQVTDYINKRIGEHVLQNIAQDLRNRLKELGRL